MRPSLRRDSDISVVFACHFAFTGRPVGWNCTKHGDARYAPRSYARIMAEALEFFANVVLWYTLP